MFHILVHNFALLMKHIQCVSLLNFACNQIFWKYFVYTGNVTKRLLTSLSHTHIQTHTHTHTHTHSLLSVTFLFQSFWLSFNVTLSFIVTKLVWTQAVSNLHSFPHILSEYICSSLSHLTLSLSPHPHQWSSQVEEITMEPAETNLLFSSLRIS